jgi:hypothetical protein
MQSSAPSGAVVNSWPDTHWMDEDDRPPICRRCGLTMVPAALSADAKP